jgi:DNA-binding transcriptional ArsR family regulator
MAVSKSSEFETKDIELAEIAKALSHPARIKILKILASTNACMCGEIVNMLPLSQATVSQHLKELKRVGFIKGDIDGPKVCYCIDKEFFKKTKKELEHFLSTIEEMNKCC